MDNENLKTKNIKDENRNATIGEIIIASIVFVILMLPILIPFYYSNPKTFIRFNIVLTLILLLLIILNKIIKLKVKHQKLTSDDFGANKDYYRDIIKDYSPLVLGYVDDFKLDDRDIVGTLLKLKMEEHINITEDNGITVLSSSTYSLKGSEKFILEEKMNKKNRDILENIVKEEAIGEGLLKKVEYSTESLALNIFLTIFISVILVMTAIFLSSPYDDIFIKEFLVDISGTIFLISVLYPLLRIPYLILYAWNIRKNPFVRTKKGEEINIKLEGLKNYITDFSMLDEKELKELKLWEDYLIYSVIFGHNKEIIKNLNIYKIK